ncbi:hypothetical protein [Algibacter sp. R77976]|uniref:hypothetical protein n=1 Tax=Algibacter sp. R77976 TaxID=3093873 RepID=UPI0037CB17B7
MNKQKALTYSLLAHIRTSSSLVKGPLDIFVPLIKRVISKMNDENIFSGKSISEIKVYSDKLYNLDFPIPVIEKILRKIAIEINTNGNTFFELYQDKSFAIKGYFFTEFEEDVRKHKVEIDNLEKLFNDFINTTDNDEINDKSIFSFIEKNKHSLSKYLSNKPYLNGEDYSVEAQFVDFFKNITPVYELIKEIYLGSILAGYIEFEPTSAKMNVELLLDTNFIIGLLDLNTSESTHTCKTLLKIATAQGYTCKILLDTIEETKALLQAKSIHFNNSFLQKKINPEDIYNACERRNLTNVDLERISDNLESELSKYKIFTLFDTRKLLNKAKYSDEYKVLKVRRNTDKAALHDAAAIIYVKEKRKKDIYQFEKVNCWFVNNAFFRENQYAYNPNGKQPEIIRADDLLNILWLSNPQSQVDISAEQIVDIGMSSLISLTLNQSLPKSSIIRELDDNIHKYGDKEISDSDIIRIATRITSKQLKNVDELNQLAENDKKEFVNRLQQEANKQKETESKRLKMLEAAVKELNSRTSNIKVVEQEFIVKENEKNSKISSLLTTTTNQTNEIENLKNKLLNEQNSKRADLREKFYAKKIGRWRLRSWIEVVLSILLVLIPFLYLCLQSNWIGSEIIDTIVKFKRDFWISIIITIFGFIFSKISLPTLVGKYRSYSNIENFKKGLKVPDEYKHLDKPST